jgi:hypothetical protein
MTVSISQTNGVDRIIIVDTDGNIELPVSNGRIDFELSGSSLRVTTIGNTTGMTATTNAHVKGFNFNATNKTIDVLDATDHSVYNTSTDGTTVLVKVEFATPTITVYE